VAFDSVSAGLAHTCGIRSDNATVTCWGSDGDGRSSDAPASMAFDAVSAGGQHTCGIRSDTLEIECWGNNDAGHVSAVPTGI
jgi:alpha-tubulin suppressor-like RCC1 family protein